ncbi:MAG TPA: FTR1 family protein, partial [Actinomycetes bacterium]|nr:FTR1 family protein [Actinomycetes bacterium]
FLAVAREGLETALFVWSAVQASQRTVAPLTGVALGLLTSVALAYFIYRGALRINLSKFFRITGALLVFVSAGVLAYGIHDLQEGGALPGLNNRAFDISGTISPDGVIGTMLKGIFNFQPNPTWLQVMVWFAYLIPVLVLFLRQPSARSKPKATQAALADA